MNEHTMQEIKRRVADEILNSAKANDAKASAMHDEATRLRAKAAELRVQADDYETRADDKDANAAMYEAAAEIKRQIAAQGHGHSVLPTPGTVTLLDRGMAIGATPLTTPQDASPEELRSLLDLMREVNTISMDAVNRLAEELRERQATIITGQISPEDLPELDPLTATPAEESGAHKIVPPSPSGRSWTPDRTEIQDGRPVTVGTVKRACNGCGRQLGDANQVELDASVNGEALPDVREECSSCSAPGDLGEPEAESSCEYCTCLLVLVEGVWIHSSTGAAECGPGSEHLTAMPVGITYRGEEDADAPEPGHVPEPAREPKRESALKGIGRVASRMMRGRQEQTLDAPYAGFFGEWPSPVPPVPVEERRPAYPTEPTTGPFRAVDPAQARLEEIVAQLHKDPSRLMQPPSHGADDPTQALPPVNGDGGGGRS